MVWLRQLVAQRLGDGARHTGRELDLVDDVAVTLEQPNLAPAQTQHLEATHRLQEAPQRLGMEAVGHHRQFLHRSRQHEDAEQPRTAQHRDAVERVVPEVRIVGQRVKRRQQGACLVRRVPLPQGHLQRLDPVAKADGVLLVLGVAPVRGLVERQAGW
jgi:hypothetical protein